MKDFGSAKARRKMNLVCTIRNERKGKTMAINSREKGARFERLLASKLRDYGYQCRRGQQYCGANGDADVVGLPGIHIEAKAVEKMQLYNWMDQSKRDAKENELPAVFHKKNNCKILVTMELEDWMKIYREFQSGMVIKARERHLSPAIEVTTENRCVCCGVIIPEGRQVCWSCENEVRGNGEYQEHC